jgi:ribosome modulation factor
MEDFRMSPFEEGVMAAQTGMSKDDNPYQPGTPQHSDWKAGYETAVEADDATDLDDKID